MDRLRHSPEVLFIHYNVSKETDRLKMEQLRRKPGETWIVCGKHYKNLVKKWLGGCEIMDDVVEMLVIDVTRLMPRSIAYHVKDCDLDTLVDGTKVADDFIHHRGWSHDLPIQDKGNLSIKAAPLI